jgi:transposase
LHPSSSLTLSQREQLVELFESGIGYRAASYRLGVSLTSVRDLRLRWNLRGRLCLVESNAKRNFSFEVKKEVVDRFLAGETKMELAAEFELSSVKVVNLWTRAWQEGGDDALKPKPKGRPAGTSKPTSLSEEDQLRQQVKRLEAENAYLKKLRDLRNQGHA